MRSRPFLLACSTLLSLALGEAVLQVHHRVKTGEWLWVESRGFQVGYAARVSDRREYALRAGFKSPDTTIDERGFRASPPSPDPAANEPVIAVIGDSVPFGFGVGDADSYPNLLARVLASHGSPVRVVNAGVPSYNIRQSLDRYAIDVRPRYKPLVVVLQAANDVSLLTNYRERWTPDITWATLRFKGMIEPKLVESFAWYHYLGAAAKKEEESHEAYPADKMLANVDRVLAERVEELARDGVPLVILPVEPFYYAGQPEARSAGLPQWPRWSGHYRAWHTTIDALNLHLSMAARPPGAIFLDTRPILNNEDRGRLFIDFIHYSREGAWLVANALHDALLERKLLPAEPETPEVLMRVGLAALFEGQDPIRALAAFERVLAGSPLHLGALYHSAVAIDQLGAESVARPYWQRALERAEGDAATAQTARDRLARADRDTDAGLMRYGLHELYERDAPVEAASAFRKVCERTPTHYGAHFQLARALDRAGMQRDALDAWQWVRAEAAKINDQPVLATATARIQALGASLPR